jgi:selenocysteine-specific elongation factor
MRSFVVGSAGHIDHGKSTLIRALTGIDPDRLAEEKRRGMTIDLGFAYLELPDHRIVGIVDVPGHARFIRNMLAGVHGLDAVLLVVAADEGVMPQTREHLEIVQLLEVSRGLVALTKIDLVDPEWLELVEAEVRETLSQTSLRSSEILQVSAVTGAGVEALKAALTDLLDEAPPRPDLGRPRLPIDRVFTMSGFGTVVTGTLIEGTVSTGEELEIMPGSRRVRIRGLQQHNRKVDRAEPGSRVALNLIGVEREQLARGHVLSRRGTLTATRRVDASVSVLDDSPRPLQHGAQVLVHTGTAEVPARVIALERDAIEPGQSGWIQLYTQDAIAAAAGDRFVLRLPSPSATLAGGRFADVAPRRHPRHNAGVAVSLERRLAGDALQEELRKYPRGTTEEGLLKATVAGPEEARQQLARLHARRAGRWLFAPEAWRALVERARIELTAYHAAHPLRPGMPREQLKSRLGLSPQAFAAVLPELTAEAAVSEVDGVIALPGHRVALDTAAAGAAARLLALLGERPFSPPSLPDAMRAAGAGPEVVRALAQAGQLVRLSPEVAFTRDAYDEAIGVVREIVQREGSVTVAALRDRLAASRRPVLALLEHLDAQRVTRRVGDARVLR